MESLKAAYVDSDFEKMEEVRARVEAIVADRETAELLKPWYRQLCKRPCFHDEYLQSFNNPSCRLIDTGGKGVESITEKGFVVAGVEYEVDCIIYASGFEVGTDYTRRSGFDMSGREGLKLSEAWGEGMRTLHGIHSSGFPNAFFVQAFQGAALISNVPHNLADSAKTIAMTVKRVLDSGAREVEVTQQAQDAWIELLLSGPAAPCRAAPTARPATTTTRGIRRRRPRGTTWAIPRDRTRSSGTWRSGGTRARSMGSSTVDRQRRDRGHGHAGQRLGGDSRCLAGVVDAGELSGFVTLIWHKGEEVQFNTLGSRHRRRRADDARHPLPHRLDDQAGHLGRGADADGGRQAGLDDPITKWMPEFGDMRVLEDAAGPVEAPIRRRATSPSTTC